MSAIIYNIDGRNKVQFDAKASKADFNYSFEKEVDLEVILHDSISLYALDENEAVFVDCGSEDIFDAKYPFAFEAQFKSAKKLIIMSLGSFLKISETITVPDIPVIHVPNHGRCGSTLLAKVFAAMPDCLSVSEIYSLSNVTEMSRTGQFDEDKLKKMIRCCTLHIMKHANQRNSQLVFMKHQHQITYITDLIMDVFPHFKHVYMYRQPMEAMKSWTKILSHSNMTLRVEDIKRATGMGKHKSMKNLPFYSTEKIESLNHNFLKMSLIWITGIGIFQSLVEQGYDIRSLKYEHLIENPRAIIESLFEYAEIPLSKMPDLELVFSKDSQSGNILANSNNECVKEFKTLTSLSEELKSEVNGICDEFKVPHFWKDVSLCNAISKK